MAHQVGQLAVPLFALIIGIDNYANGWNLRGPVTDADAIKEYLEEVLHVSEDHIRTLYNDEATREAIIKAFKDLQGDERINTGDPIVIYYAGHGVERPAPHAWGLGPMIQCLLPQDYKAQGAEPIPGHEPIPDRTIGALIEGIAKAKGDNITVIFDCCHSASCTRSPDDHDDHDDEYKPRRVVLDINIPESLDDDILEGREGTIADGFAHRGLRSHVLLAACDEKEFAYEYKGHGQFTSALLEALKGCSVNDVTYAELLDRIHLKKQHPQCAGFNQHRVLFDARVPAGGRVNYPIHNHKRGKYIVSAGLAHGVLPGVEFTLYSKEHLRLDDVLIDETCSINDFETTITPSVDFDSVSYAKLTRVGKLPLYVALDDSHSLVLETHLRAIGHSTHPKTFQLVEAEKAKLEVAMEDDSVVFKVLDERVKRFGLTELPYKAALDSVARVLSYAAHYYWFLSVSKEHDRFKHGTVAVDFYSLEVDFDDYGLPLFLPIEPGFCRRDPSSDNSNVIDFVVDPKACYGVKLTNNTSRDLYLNAFLFNSSSLSIVPYYIQSSAGTPQAPLKRGETLPIGYGPGGISPFQYSLKASQDVDVGYLKIFFATLPIDLSDVEQSSPFSNMDTREGSPRSDGWGIGKIAWTAVSKFMSLFSKSKMWFTLEIPVVQRRYAAM